jgi:hypothetical protein
MNDTSPIKYRVMCQRSAGSMFGAAEAYLKKDGAVVEFPTKEAAEEEASRLRRAVRISGNITYYAVAGRF